MTRSLIHVVQFENLSAVVSFSCFFEMSTQISPKNIKCNDRIENHIEMERNRYAMTDQMLDKSKLNIPCEIKNIILQFTYHELIQCLCAEEIAIRQMDECMHLPEIVTKTIIGYTFENWDISQCNLQINHPGPLGGALKGTLCLPHKVNFHVNFGNGDFPNQFETQAWNFDLKRMDLFGLHELMSPKQKRLPCIKREMTLA